MSFEIKIAPNSGFCFGVKRAIDIADRTLKSGGKVYSLGPIIHNPQVIDRLRSAGLETVDRPRRHQGRQGHHPQPRRSTRGPRTAPCPRSRRYRRHLSAREQGPAERGAPPPGALQGHNHRRAKPSRGPGAHRPCARRGRPRPRARPARNPQARAPRGSSPRRPNRPRTSATSSPRCSTPNGTKSGSLTLFVMPL